MKPSALRRQELVTLFVPLAANRCSESSERKLVSGVWLFSSLAAAAAAAHNSE